MVLTFVLSFNFDTFNQFQPVDSAQGASIDISQASAQRPVERSGTATASSRIPQPYRLRKVYIEQDHCVMIQKQLKTDDVKPKRVRNGDITRDEIALHAAKNVLTCNVISTSWARHDEEHVLQRGELSI